MIRFMGGGKREPHEALNSYGAVSEGGVELAERVNSSYDYQSSFGGVPSEGSRKSNDLWKRFAVWIESKLSSNTDPHTSSQNAAPDQPPGAEMSQQGVCDKDNESVESADDDYCHGFGKCTCVGAVVALVVVVAMAAMVVALSQEDSSYRL